MLNRLSNGANSELRVDVKVPHAATGIDFDILLAAARRQARIVVVAGVLGSLIGLAYVVTAIPEYTATMDLLIASQKDKGELTATIAELGYDTGAIDSQVEVLKSEKIALAVVDTLKLTSDPEFMGSRGTLFGQFFSAVRTTLDLNQWFTTRQKSDLELTDQLHRAAIKQIKENLSVRRIARTYVLSIEYTSPDSLKAAKIANAFGEAYLNDQLDSKYEATKRASGWLQARIAELKKQSLDSDSAVQKFKAENGLISTDGKLVTDQQLEELNSQLVLAHGETARAEARYNQIQDMLKTGETDGAVTESLGSPVVNDLRQKYLTASKTEAQLEVKLGPNHLQVVALRQDMAEYKRLIFDELRRIAETYKSEGEVARQKEKSLNESMTSLVAENAGTNQTMVQLRELEREADTYKTLYQAFLARYQDAVQQQSFPVTEARIITAATPTSIPTYPKRSLILAVSAVFGLLIGAGLGALREHRDRVFRSASQVREELGLEFLGMLQVVSSANAKRAEKGAQKENPRELKPRDTIQTYSIDHALSSFSETLRSIKVAVDISLPNHKPKIIGVVSALPNEGKSTVSKNFASLLAHLGAKTLLIDADLRNPGLTRNVAIHADVGLLECLSLGLPLNDALLVEPESGLFMLPAVVRKRVQHSSEVISSAAMRSLLGQAGTTFDYIVVDLPPLGPVIDVRAAASMFDSFVFVIEWGRTARAMVQNILASDEILHQKTIGAVYNKVKLNRINLYEGYGSKDYYYGRYTKYYRKDKVTK